MKVRIEIDTKTFVRFWLVVIAFGLIGFLIYSARVGLIIVGSALFLALALNGPVSKLATYLPGKSRVGSTAIAFLAIVGLLGAFLFLAVPPIIQQTAKFVETVPGLVEEATNRWHGLDSVIAEYNLQPQVDQTLNSMKDNASKFASNVGATILSSVGSVFSLMAASFLVIVLAFLMLVEGPEWRRRIWNLYRNDALMVRHRKVADKMHRVVAGYVTGQLTVSGIGASAAGVAVFALSLFTEVPSNLAIPAMAITFILSLIPMFGATIAGVLITALLAFNAPWAGVIYFVYFVVYQQIENNFISPAIQAKRVELSALVVLASVTIGLYLLGIAGGIVSIPIAGCIKVLLEDYLSHRDRHVPSDEKPVAKLVRKIKKASEA